MRNAAAEVSDTNLTLFAPSLARAGILILLVLVTIDSRRVKFWKDIAPADRDIGVAKHQLRSGIPVDVDAGNVSPKFSRQILGRRNRGIAELERLAHPPDAIIIKRLVFGFHGRDIGNEVSVRGIDDKVVDIVDHALIQRLCLADKLGDRIRERTAEDNEDATVPKQVVGDIPCVGETGEDTGGLQLLPLMIDPIANGVRDAVIASVDEDDVEK